MQLCSTEKICSGVTKQEASAIGLAEIGATLLGTVMAHAPAEAHPGHCSHQQLMPAILE